MSDEEIPETRQHHIPPEATPRERKTMPLTDAQLRGEAPIPRAPVDAPTSTGNPFEENEKTDPELDAVSDEDATQEMPLEAFDDPTTVG